MEAPVQRYCLKWNNYQSHIMGVFCQLLATESLVDVTLYIEGRKVKAHKAVLTACSPYFQDVFVDTEDRHPIVILNGYSYEDIKAIMDFMYKGELNVTQEHLPGILKAADGLKIKGLTEITGQSPFAEALRSEDNPKKNEDVDVKNTDDSSASYSHKDYSNSAPTCPRADLPKAEGISEVGEGQEIGTAVPIQIQTEGGTPTVLHAQLIKLPDSNTSTHAMEILMEATDMVTEQQYCDEEEDMDSQESIILEGDSSEGNPKKRQKRRENLPRKEYSAEMFAAALNDLKEGKHISETAFTYGIPRSTLYVRAKSLGIPLSMTRHEYSEEGVQAAVKSVEDGASLKQASEQFKIPKTVLWRRVQKAAESPQSPLNAIHGKTARRAPTYLPAARQAAVEALERGENLAKVSQEFQIPKTTLFRDKTRLIEAGKLPDSAIRKQGVQFAYSEDQVEKAVDACRMGQMSQAIAAMTYNVPKTTIWRRLQMDRRKEGEESPVQLEGSMIMEGEAISHMNTETPAGSVIILTTADGQAIEEDGHIIVSEDPITVGETSGEAITAVEDAVAQIQCQIAE